MSERKLVDTVAIRPFRWTDLKALYELMSRAGDPPYAFTTDPIAALAKDLTQPRMTATSDVWLAEANDSLFGWVRVDLELGIGRAVLGVGVDTARAGEQALLDLIGAGIQRSKTAGVRRIHISVPEGEPRLLSAITSAGFEQVRVYYWMRLDPRDVDGRFKTPSVPASFSIRPMRLGVEEKVLTEIQNRAFTGMWGFAPNTIHEVEAKLELPGCHDPGVLFAVDSANQPVAYVWTRFEPGPRAPHGFIGMVGVLPRCRRSGLGKAMTAAGIQALISAGARLVWLEVDRDNRGARKIYEDLGFRRNARTLWYELDLAR